jgi:hypothetical protein
MIGIEQSITPYLTGAKSFVNAAVSIHLIKEFCIKYWIGILIVLAVIGVVIYKVKATKQKEEMNFQKLLEKAKTEAKPIAH